MTKWPKYKDSYTVKITYDKYGRARATIPAPLVAGFDMPNTLTFELNSGTITAKFERKVS